MNLALPLVKRIRKLTIARRDWLRDQGWIPVVLLHVVLAYSLIENASFGKYPQYVALLKVGKLIGDQAAPPSPLYLLLNLAFSSEILRFFQIVAGCFLIRSVYRVGYLLGGLCLAVGSVVILSLSRPFLIYESILEPDFLLMAGLFCGLYYFLFSRSLKGQIVGAVLLGASVSLRPVVFPTSLLILSLGFFSRCGKETQTKTWKARTLLIVTFLTLMIAPKAIVSQMTHSPLTQTMSPELVIYEGNRPESTGDGAQPIYLLKIYEKQVSPGQPFPDYAHELYPLFAKLISHKALATIDYQKFWLSFSIHYIEEHPVAFFKVQMRKLAFALTGSDFFDTRPARKLEYQWRNQTFLLGGQLMFCLALIGVFGFCSLGNWPGTLVLIWSTLVFSLMPFFISTRYQMPLLPFEALFGGSIFLVLSTTNRIRSKRILFGFFPGVLVVLLLLTWEPIRESRRFNERLISSALRWAEINEDRASNQHERMVSSFNDVQADFPYSVWEADYRLLPFESRKLALQAVDISKSRWGTTYTTDRIFLAQLYEWAGDCLKAEDIVRTLEDTTFVPTYWDLSFDPRLIGARCAVLRADLGGAKNWVERSLQVLPGNREALTLGYAIAKQMNDPSKISEYKRELFLLHDLISAQFSLAQSFRTIGNFAEAYESIEVALSYLPEFSLFHHEKALILAEQGKWVQSAQAFNRAITSFPTFNYRVSPFDLGFDQLLTRFPNNREIVKARIRQLARNGNVDDALTLVQKEVETAKNVDDPVFEEMYMTLLRAKNRSR